MFIQVTTKADAKTIKVNITQICWIDGSLLTFGNGLTIEVTDSSLEKLETAIMRGRNKAETTEDNKDLVELFGKLHTLTGGKGKPIFNVKRQNQLKFLLDPKKGNMTEEQLIRAATNIGNDAFLQGDNDNKKRYGDVDYLLRQDKAAKWADETEKKKKGMF
jgi:hypothetical protein